MIEPIVPAGLDLTSFDFMPVEWARLLASDTWLLSNDAEKVAAITLWGRSWSQVPAGSLPSDDRLLALLSGAGARWKRVKATALRGWVQASDGRLYHPIICEKALEAWLEKLASQLSSGAGNKKRWGAEFDPEPIKAQMAEARERLKALNPDSRQLRKRRFAAHSDAVPDDSQQHPAGMPSRSQQTETETEELPSDTSTRLGVSEWSSERLARALRGAGYPECAASFPGLVEAEREGVTETEIAAIAIKAPGKPLAYVIETARGRRRDAAERATRTGTPPAAPVDPQVRAEAEARHACADEILRAENDLRLELISPAKCDERIASAQAAFRDRFPNRPVPAPAAREATA